MLCCCRTMLGVTLMSACLLDNADYICSRLAGAHLQEPGQLAALCVVEQPSSTSHRARTIIACFLLQLVLQWVCLPLSSVDWEAFCRMLRSGSFSLPAAYLGSEPSATPNAGWLSLLKTDCSDASGSAKLSAKHHCRSHYLRSSKAVWSECLRGLD